MFLPHKACTMPRFPENMFLRHNFGMIHRSSIVPLLDSAMCIVRLHNNHMLLDMLFWSMQKHTPNLLCT